MTVKQIASRVQNVLGFGLFTYIAAKHLLPEPLQSKYLPTFSQHFPWSATPVAGDANIETADQAYLRLNAQKPGVHTTVSGLQYMIIKKGIGKSPYPTSTTTVDFHMERGASINGVVFQPTTTPTRKVHQMFAGLAEGLALMQAGDRYEFTIPSELGFGKDGIGYDLSCRAEEWLIGLQFVIELMGMQKCVKVPGGSTLVFDVELLHVHPDEEPDGASSSASSWGSWGPLAFFGALWELLNKEIMYGFGMKHYLLFVLAASQLGRIGSKLSDWMGWRLPAEYVDVSHIQVQGETEAADLYKRATEEGSCDPIKFGELAKEYSTCTSGVDHGGAIGTYGRGELMQEFEEVVWTCKVDEVQPPVKSEQHGWHILFVTARYTHQEAESAKQLEMAARPAELAEAKKND